MMTNIPQTHVLSTRLTATSYSGAISALCEQIKSAASSQSAQSIILSNVHVVTEAALNPLYRAAVDDASLVLPDGMPLIWALRAQGHRLKDRCYGPEFMARVLDVSQTHGWRHFLYGTTRETLETLCRQIGEQWPKAVIAGRISPPFGPFDDEVELRNIARINASGATIVWIGMGCPKQELWMQRYRHHLHGSVVIASGQAFDTIAGLSRRVPRWMQRYGLEWAFRLATNPRRLWKRYLFRNPYFIFQFALQLCGIRWRH